MRPPGGTHPRTRHLGHFSGQRKVSVLMRTTWGKPGSASAGRCFPGLNQKASKAGRALADFSPPAARCQPSQPRHCCRVVRLGANTLHGGSAACPKRRVRRRAETCPPRAKLPSPLRRPEKGKGSFDSNASPSTPAPPRENAEPKHKTSPGQGRAHPEMFHVEHSTGRQFCKNNVPRGTF